MVGWLVATSLSAYNPDALLIREEVTVLDISGAGAILLWW
jgi:hypothetical protein